MKMSHRWNDLQPRSRPKFEIKINLDKGPCLDKIRYTYYTYLSSFLSMAFILFSLFNMFTLLCNIHFYHFLFYLKNLTLILFAWGVGEEDNKSPKPLLIRF